MPELNEEQIQHYVNEEQIQHYVSELIEYMYRKMEHLKPEDALALTYEYCWHNIPIEYMGVVMERFEDIVKVPPEARDEALDKVAPIPEAGLQYIKSQNIKNIILKSLLFIGGSVTIISIFKRLTK